MVVAQSLSKTFHVRELTDMDVEIVLELCRKNKTFYQYHPPFVTRASILSDMKALPLGKSYTDKLYVGFFEDDRLAAVMDLILDYPEEHVAHIGFFMVDVEWQNAGVGSKIVGDTMAYLQKEGFMKFCLGVDKGNPQSFAFWKKNGFSVVREDEYIRMERNNERGR